MGEFKVKGKDSLSFLQKVTSNDVSKLVPGKVQYSCLPNEKGGIVDDLLVYMLGENDYFLVVNASNIEKDWNHLVNYQKDFDITLENISDQYSLLAIQGPKSESILTECLNIDLSNVEYYSFITETILGNPDTILSATGYTGERGFEIYVPNNIVEELWKLIITTGKDDIQPIGLGARDTLRLEKGYCLYGNDITDTTSPLEAGLGWITKFNKDFVGKSIIQSHKESGLKQKLTSFILKDRGIPRHGHSIVTSSDQVVGKVTSGSISPILNKGICLAYIDSAYLEDQLFVEIRNKKLALEKVKLPFV